MIVERRILITGATGGLGLALVELARAGGHDVIATGRSSQHKARIEATGARFIAADLLNDVDLASLCDGCDSVVHAAALSASWGRREEFEAINVDATRSLVDAARQAGCTKFIYISSPSIFAAFRDRLNIRAVDAPTSPPLNEYARTKLAAERFVLAANKNDFTTCAVRPRAIVGPDDKVLLPRLKELALQKRILLPRGGKAEIELTDVRDAATAIMLAHDHVGKIAGRGINISGGKTETVHEMATALAEKLGRKPEFRDLPMPVARTIATLAEWAAKVTRSQTEPLLTRYTLATLAFSQSFDHSEAARLIGYHPKHDGLATLLDQAERTSL